MVDFPTINASEILQDVREAISSPIGIGVATTAGVVAIGTGIVAVAKRRKKKATARRKRRVTRVRTARRRRKLTPLMRRRKKIIARPGRQTPYTARGGKDRSTRRIRMTKHGQPYIILASGKARFISKRSARASRKRKGGRY